MGDTKSPSPLKGLRAEGVAPPSLAKYAVKTIIFSRKSRCYSTCFFAVQGLFELLLSAPALAANRRADRQRRRAERPLFAVDRGMNPTPGQAAKQRNSCIKLVKKGGDRVRSA